jgi:hypothetical protein
LRPDERFEIRAALCGQLHRSSDRLCAIHIISVSGGMNFTPDMQIALQAQFDNISRSFSFSAAIAGNIEPGNELFVSLGQNALIPGTTFEPKTSQVSVRLGHTLAF